MECVVFGRVGLECIAVREFSVNYHFVHLIPLLLQQTSTNLQQFPHLSINISFNHTTYLLTFSLFNYFHFHLPGNVLHDIRQGDSYRNKKDELEELGITFYIHKQPRGRQNQSQLQVQLQHQNHNSNQSQSQAQSAHEHEVLHAYQHPNVTSSPSTYVTDDNPAKSHDSDDTDDILLSHPSVSHHLINHHTTNAVSPTAPQSFNCFMEEIVSLV